MRFTFIILIVVNFFSCLEDDGIAPVVVLPETTIDTMPVIDPPIVYTDTLPFGPAQGCPVNAWGGMNGSYYQASAAFV